MSGPDATGSVPRGSYAAGRRILLPPGAREPVVVYINGLVQTESRDYSLRGNEILFNRDIIKEELGLTRKLAMLLSFFGTYRKDETVDVQFEREGKTELAADMKIQD